MSACMIVHAVTLPTLFTCLALTCSRRTNTKRNPPPHSPTQTQSGRITANKSHKIITHVTVNVVQLLRQLCSRIAIKKEQKKANKQ